MACRRPLTQSAFGLLMLLMSSVVLNALKLKPAQHAGSGRGLRPRLSENERKKGRKSNWETRWHPCQFLPLPSLLCRGGGGAGGSSQVRLFSTN